MLKLYAHSSCRRMATCTIRLQNSTSDIGNTHFNRDRKDMKKQVKVTDYHRRAERTPLKAPTMLDAAKQLGFNTIKEMYPAYPLEKPPRMWMITQIKSMYGYPYWVKDTMKELGLYKKNDISIQINSPNMNEALWQIKSLIRIKPITFPDGFPTEEDVGFTKLCSDGTFKITQKLQNDDPSKIPVPMPEDYKVPDGLKISDKFYLTKEENNFEAFPSRIVKFVENPDKKCTRA